MVTNKGVHSPPETRSIDIYFGDYKCSGSTYKNIPDVVGLQDTNGTTEIKLVGKLKTPWVDEHVLLVATAKNMSNKQ
mgnify:FL=1